MMHDPMRVEQALSHARALLQANLTPYGVLAAGRTPAAEARRYTRIFGRDAAICALGMLVSGDPTLCSGARNGLLTLARYQAANGQIPKYVDAERGQADFWYLGCIDATLWWLIAVKLFSRLSGDARIEEELAEPSRKALTWLGCQEHPQICLVRQDEASDWADIMPRSGFVLYSNALWYYVKCLYGLPHREATKFHFNHLFYPFSNDVPDYRRLRLLRHYVRNRAKRSELYLSFVNFSFWGAEGDVFGNILAILMGLADDGPANRIAHVLEQASASSPYPMVTVLEPIAAKDPLWRAYMGRHRQNLAWQYHNGGVWPFIGGFWVMALCALGKRKSAMTELQRLASANAVGNWGFVEWFHGRTGEARGMTGQSWNAAMFLLAHYALEHRVF
ncbi:MAG: glycoside hydrolase [Betaproteobacteria bacterium]|nr:glycoside hydrolase [Betaproteobacteria bacterium]